jgi:hypothetical protein
MGGGLQRGGVSAITYRADFFTKGLNIVFEDLDEYKDTVKDIVSADEDPDFNAEDPYFCNIRAYGTPNPNRSIKNADVYYATIIERNWPEFTALNPRPTFSQMLAWFRPKKAESTLFPNLGPLGALCLVGDMAYAQVCQMPTIMDMADAAVEVNSGAVLGLHDLGLLCHPLRGEREEKVRAVADAMEVFASKVEESFTAEEREEMGWDVIVMEHSLCKFHRFLSLLT